MKKEPDYKGRPLVVGTASIIDGTLFVDFPDDRERFNLGRLEGKTVKIKAYAPRRRSK